VRKVEEMFGKRVMDETGDDEKVKGPIKQMLTDKYVHYKRVGEILSALSKFGYGKVWDSATLLKDMPFDSVERKELMELKDSIRFRMLLENLGPTFVKLGQMLSTRPDLIPEDFAEELASLRDDVTPITFEEVRTVIEDELKGKLGDLYATFDEKPLAAASIGQVHVATLNKTGEKVAVKIQRPNITETIKADIEILKNLAVVLERTFKSIDRFDPKGIIDEFSHMMMRELDYTIEARNIQRFKNNMKDIEGLVIPKVFWKLSSRKVITMEFIDGAPIDKVEQLKKWKTDFKAITDILGKAYIKQVFVDGFFHGDPHQGNIFVLRGNKVCLLDFGAIGFLDDETRDRVGLFYLALTKQEVGKAARALVDICKASPKDMDIQKLEWDLRDFVDYNFLKKEKVPVDRGMNQKIVTIALKHKLMLPASFVLLERALMQLEGVCRSVNPDFDIAELTEKNLLMLIQARYGPKMDPMQGLETAHQYREFMRHLPHRADKLLTKIENDAFTVKVDTAWIDDLKKHLRKTALILAISLVAAALVIFLALTGKDLGLGIVPHSLAVVSVVLVWAISVFVIYRRG
jgi:ubiquinone biosynthesis protein